MPWAVGEAIESLGGQVDYGFNLTGDSLRQLIEAFISNQTCLIGISSMRTRTSRRSRYDSDWWTLKAQRLKCLSTISWHHLLVERTTTVLKEWRLLMRVELALVRLGSRSL